MRLQAGQRVEHAVLLHVAAVDELGGARLLQQLDGGARALHLAVTVRENANHGRHRTMVTTCGA